MIAAAVVLLVLTESHNLSEDELDFLLNRGGHDPETFLEAHNEHLVLGPLLVYKTLFQIFGVESYLPYRLTVVALDLLCAGLLYALARRRMGPLPALVPAIVLLFLGTAWEAVLQLALIVFLLPLAAGLGMLLALEREDPRWDVIAGACLLVALASGSLGVIMGTGAAVLIALGPRPARRLATVVAGPAALYAVWWLAYADSQLLDQWGELPRLVTRYVAGNIAALAGFGYDTAPALWTALAVLLAVAVVHAIVRRVEAWRLLVALAAMVLAFWAVVVLFRPPMDEPPSRYLHAGSAFLLLLLVCVVGRRRIAPPVAAGLAVATALVVAAQIGDLREGARSLDRRAEFLGPSLGALELARGQVPDDFRPEPTRAPDLTAGRYFAATDAYGSPADSPSEIARRPEEARRAADIVSTRALEAHLRRRARLASTHPGCRSLALRGDARRVELRLPAAGILLRAPPGEAATMRLRRFGSGYGPDAEAPGKRFFPLSVFRPPLTPLVLVLDADRSAELRIPRDRARLPWHLGLAGNGPVLACPAAG
jgi:hypothetical protein